MTLTIQEIDAIRKGEPVHTAVPEVGTDCVLVRADVFERLQRRLADEWSDEEINALAAQTMANADLAGPIP